MVQLCYSTSSGQLPEFSAVFFFFLLQAKVQEYYKQMNDLVSETYSEEDQQIIGCPSIQQVSTSTVLLQLLNECKYLWYLTNRKWWKLKKSTGMCFSNRKTICCLRTYYLTLDVFMPDGSVHLSLYIFSGFPPVGSIMKIVLSHKLKYYFVSIAIKIIVSSDR